MESIIKEINLFMTIHFSQHKLIGLTALCSAIALDYFVFASMFHEEIPNGLAFLFAEGIFLLGLLIVAKVTEKTLFPLWYFCAFFALIGSLAPFVTNSEIGLYIATTEILLANTLLIISFLNTKNVPSRFFELINWTIVQPFEKLVKGVACVFEKIGMFWKQRNNKERAIVIGIPAALVTLLLLSQTDPLLAEIVDRLAEFLPDFFFAHLFTIFFVALGLFILLLGPTLPEADIAPYPQHHQSPIAWSLVLGLLNVPLAIFVGSQLATYLLQKMGTMDFALTYSEYATRGVVEACVATLLCSTAVALAWSKEEKNQEKLMVPTGIMACALILVTIVAETRVLNYIQEFGFTPTRIVGALGILTLLGAIILSNILLLTKKNIHQPLFASGVLMMIFMALIPLMQLDTQSMRLNIARATAIEPLDSDDISDLSSEAYPAFLKAIEENVPMEGMITECSNSKSRVSYNRFIRKAEKKEDVRWMNMTLPGIAMNQFLAAHDLPEECK